MFEMAQCGQTPVGSLDLRREEGLEQSLGWGRGGEHFLGRRGQ